MPDFAKRFRKEVTNKMEGKTMTIDEAIKENEHLLRSGLKVITMREAAAIKLGIEALKAWKEHRGAGSLMDKLLLLGETEA